MKDRPAQPGFTLVELMVTLALLGLVMAVIFGLFASTSDSLKEADSLADTLERARFAIQQVSGDLRSAGAFASPDSQRDTRRVQPQRIGSNSTLQVAGVSSYSDWQNQRPFSDEIKKAQTPKGGSGAGPAVSFDGFIVFGAINFPETFEIAHLNFNGSGAAKGGWIPDTGGSLHKLLLNDPFYTHVNLPDSLALSPPSGGGASATPSGEALQDYARVVTEDMQNRLIRVMDRDGKVQFGGVKTNSPTPTFKQDASVPGGAGIEFGIQAPFWVVQNSAGQGETQYGLERHTAEDEDIRYDASLVDAYWYHVEQDPRDPVNYRLVRDRLNAYETASALFTEGPAKITGADLAKSPYAAVDHDTAKTARDRVVITDRVVDFQVWFDCAIDDGTVSGVSWQMDWPNPAGTRSAAGTGSTPDCMDINNPIFGAARTGHIRLSVRTQYERKDAPDGRERLFLDEDGATNKRLPLRYFDMYPKAEGAARVVTVQTDVELTNFAMHNLTKL